MRASPLRRVEARAQRGLFLFTDALGDVSDDALPHLERVVVTFRGRRIVLHLRVEAEVFRLRHRGQMYYNPLAHIYQSEMRPVRGLS
jgi:hypothetical protein